MIFSYPLPPTIIPDCDDCEPSYTMDAQNKVYMKVCSIFMEWLGSGMTENVTVHIQGRA